MKALVLLILGVGLISQSFAAITSGSVYVSSSGEFSYSSGSSDPNAVAFGQFDDALTEKGWGILKITTNKNFPNAQQMYAAGYLEGTLSNNRIYEGFINIRESFFGPGKPISDPAKEFLLSQWEWTKKLTAKYAKVAELWEHAGYITEQVKGLVDGYNSLAEDSKKLELADFLMLQADGDIGSVLQMFNVTNLDWDSMDASEFGIQTRENMRCSGFIKFKEDLSDFFVGHSTWYTYQSMNRIYKIYYLDLNSNSGALLGKGMAFSSYPGVLASIDDYYLMSNGIIMISTTNEVFNNDLLKKIKPESLFTWQRVRIANMIGDSGKIWYRAFSSYNSGTYNNQYMILDTKLFTPGEALKPDTLWIVEQIPSIVLGEDRTTDLATNTYWASYNVPFFQKIYDLSDYQVGVEHDENEYVYNSSFRANIFRRDHTSVKDLDAMKSIMRYNDYKNDPLQLGKPEYGVCCRTDLAAEDANMYGCSDSKVTTWELYKTLTSVAVNGPTTSHDLSPFQWSTSPFASVSHLGQPDVWNFDWIQIDGGINVELDPFSFQE